jgi:hypothetical protein
MKFWSNFAKNGEPGFSTNDIKWDFYNVDENDAYSYILLDKRKHLKMTSDNLTLQKLSKEIFIDERLTEIEKCVILYQMFTYVGADTYDKNIKEYPGTCNREESENFIVNNASVIDYD